jgi:hypothetical protein
MTMTGKNGNQVNLVSNSSKVLVLLDSTFQYSKADIKKDHAKIIAFDVPTHHNLSSLDISHSLSDDYLKRAEREELYDFVISMYNWYTNVPESKDLEFDGVNLLSLMSPLEFHEYFLSNLITFFSIKNIIEQEKPHEIFLTGRLSKFLDSFFDKKHITVLNDPNLIYDKGGQDKGFTADQIELRFNVFSKPVSMYISKKTYSKLKNIYENTICSFFNLWFNPHKQEKGVLLLEFNPAVYNELLTNLNSTGKPIILLNRRRSAIWNKESLKILKKCTNCKILNDKKFLNSNDKSNLSELKKRYHLNLQNLWQNEKLFQRLFSKSGISFWHIVKKKMIDLHYNRLDEYLEYLFTVKKALESLNLDSIVMLNETGETENAVLKINKSKISTFLLQHAFARFVPDFLDEQWRYEDQRMVSFQSDKFLIWGKTDFEFFSKFGIREDKLIITGSPRHDSFSIEHGLSSSKKLILLTLTPITDRTGLADINLAIKYEKLLKKLLDFIKQSNNIDIIIKLHPGENWHNSSLVNFFQKNYHNIPVYQTRSPKGLIQSSDLVININNEIYDHSTIMLEAMVLQKPVLQISLDNQFQNSDYDSGNPILALSYEADWEKYIKKILFEKNFSEQMILNSNIHLKNFLSFQDNASKKVTNEIIKTN